MNANAYKQNQKTVGGTTKTLLILVIATILLAGGLGSRLFYLQIINSRHNRQLADNNRIRLLPRPPERGRILDRTGHLLAGSQLSHSVFVWPLAQSKSDWLSLLPRLAVYLDVPVKEIQNRLEQAGYGSPFPLRILRNASPEVVIRLEENTDQLPGVMVEAETIRYYPNGDLAAHVLGYTGEIPIEQLKSNPEANYRMGDIVGLTGVERSFESSLRGKWGGQQVEVDARGEVLRILGEQPPLPGQTIQLTLDVNLQRIAEKALNNRMGTVVALDPRDGAILAMASYPTYDPNIFSGQISQAQWERVQSQQFPFLNRSMRAFPPASTFKIITTAAALESKIFSPQTVLNTAPYISVSGHRFWDWNRAGFGPLTFQQAMAYSSDTFFYQIALGIGAGPIQEWSRRLGLGQPTGIDLLGEHPGLVPDNAWKRKVLREGWYAGDTVNMSIGQGFMSATPLQMAVVTAAIANNGWRIHPYLMQNGADAAPRQWIGLSATTLKVIQEGLRDVIQYGTGRALALGPEFPADAGKSGTAEDPPRRSHTWFVSYAPYEKPEIVVVAFLENSGGGGGSVAGPICKEILEAYFRSRSRS